MTVIFIRHSHPDRTTGSKDADLTTHGVQVAHEAAAWLDDRGLVPSVFVHAKWKRCAQTAKVIAGASEGPPAALPTRGGIPTRAVTWDRFANVELDALIPEKGTVAVVGSHTTQRMLTRRFDVPAIPTAHRCAIVVLTDTGGAWAYRDSWPGLPPHPVPST